MSQNSIGALEGASSVTLYDRFASLYDITFKFNRYSRSVERYLREREIPLGEGARVLDAGCGTGRVTALLAERLPRGHVVAVDGSAAMVEQARARLGARAEVLVADLLDLELAEPVDAEQLGFDPWHCGGGLVPHGFLNRLRAPAYVGSREGRS
jgi:SAM-dependent methyltransferase